MGQGEPGVQSTCPKDTEQRMELFTGRGCWDRSFLLQETGLKHWDYESTQKLGFPELMQTAGTPYTGNLVHPRKTKRRGGSPNMSI